MRRVFHHQEPFFILRCATRHKGVVRFNAKEKNNGWASYQPLQKWKCWFRVHTRYVPQDVGYSSLIAASHGKCRLPGPHPLSTRLQWPRISAFNWLFMSPLCINTLKDRKPKNDGKPKKLVIYDKHKDLVLDTLVHLDNSDHFGNIHSFYKSISEQRVVNLKLLNRVTLNF